MATSLTSQSEIIARLQEIRTSRQKMLAKLQKQLHNLNTEEAGLLVRLQTQDEDESAGQPDFSRFKDTTSRLLTEFWNSPDHILSYDDIREDVIFDSVANDDTIRQVISRARRELSDMRCPYEIKNLRKDGYRLTKKHDKNIKTSKTPKKRR